MINVLSSLFGFFKSQTSEEPPNPLEPSINYGWPQDINLGDFKEVFYSDYDSTAVTPDGSEYSRFLTIKQTCENGILPLGSTTEVYQILLDAPSNRICLEAIHAYYSSRQCVLNVCRSKNIYLNGRGWHTVITPSGTRGSVSYDCAVVANCASAGGLTKVSNLVVNLTGSSFWSVIGDGYTGSYNAGDNVEFHNCVFISSGSTHLAYLNGAYIKCCNCLFITNTVSIYRNQGNIDFINCAFTNLGGTPAAGAYVSVVSCISGVTYDTYYNLTSGVWENAGSATTYNRDDTQAHIGVYGGENAWVVEESDRYYVFEVDGGLAGTGVAINELILKDSNDTIIPYTVNSVDAWNSDTDSVPTYWNNTIWDKTHLNNTNSTYGSAYSTYLDGITSITRITLDLGAVHNSVASMTVNSGTLVTERKANICRLYKCMANPGVPKVKTSDWDEVCSVYWDLATATSNDFVRTANINEFQDNITTEFLVIEVENALAGNAAVLNEVEFRDASNSILTYTVLDVFDEGGGEDGDMYYSNPDGIWGLNNLNDLNTAYGSDTSVLLLFPGNIASTKARILIQFSGEVTLDTVIISAGDTASTTDRKPERVNFYTVPFDPGKPRVATDLWYRCNLSLFWADEVGGHQKIGDFLL